jgi:hypothetical protein
MLVQPKASRFIHGQSVAAGRRDFVQFIRGELGVRTKGRRICGTDDESVLSGAQTAYSSDFPRAKMSFQALTMQDSRPSWMQKTLGSAPRATLLMQLCAGSKRPLASLGLWVVSEV